MFPYTFCLSSRFAIYLQSTFKYTQLTLLWKARAEARAFPQSFQFVDEDLSPLI